ncbi:MAG: hypothetical protein WCD86_15515 [Ktedonobacteraceae bacterium]
MSSQAPNRPPESPQWQAQPQADISPGRDQYPPHPPAAENQQPGYGVQQPYPQQPGYGVPPQQPPVYYAQPPVYIIQQPAAKPSEPNLYWAIWLTIILYIVFLPVGYIASTVSYLTARAEKKQTGQEKKGFAALRVIWWIGNVLLIILVLMVIFGLILEATGQVPG